MYNNTGLCKELAILQKHGPQYQLQVFCCLRYDYTALHIAIVTISLQIPQTVKVHIFNYGPGDVVVGAPSSFSAYLLWAV